MEKVVETVERTGLSYNMASQLINDVNAASGQISMADQENVIYNKKLKRIADKMREKKIEEKKGRSISGLMFDERKDITRMEDNMFSRK